jgi:PAS domain S-box-containing protein
MNNDPDPFDKKAYDPPGPRDEGDYDQARSSGGTAHETTDIHRLLVESVRDYAIFALDATGHVLTWNPGAERFKGWTAEEIIGRHFSTFYPVEDIAAGKPAYELRVAERDGSVEDEGWRVRKDGSRFWANVVITALRDPDGKLIGFAKVTRDLTERREAERVIRQSEQRFRLLVQSAKDYAIFMLDPTGRVISWNEGAQRINGYAASEIIGRHFSTFYPAEDIAAGKPPWELREALKHGRLEDEGWRLRKDGSLFWANVIITPMRDDEGKVLGFAKVTRDLTERRRSEELRLADARRLAEVEAMNRAKSEFLTALSHELRTPLNAIGGYTDLLLHEIRGPLTEAQRLDLGRIRQSQHHLLALINDLLNFARVEGGHVEYRFDAVAMRTVLEAIAAMAGPLASEKNLAFEVMDCPDDASVWADGPRVQQILLNLVTNAVKFTPQGGRVSMTCSVVGDQVVVSVLDTGPGIPEDKWESIFEPFVQLGRSLTSAHEGVGLGLAISRELARAMGGDLKLSSHLGQGSTFTLILPRAPTR